jgi:tetratricopeptide (TPR) repeat protein
MYNQAKEYLSKGAVQQSIVLFKNAIQTAPKVMLLYRDLGQALNIAGNHEEAYQSIEYVLKNGQADEMTYQIAGAALLGKGDQKSARRIIETGIKAYPSSGMLFGELGKYHEINTQPELALAAWLKGIQSDPAYHLNYYNAARLYAGTDKSVWTIIYGEIYVNLDRHSTRAIEIRELMLKAYRTVFHASGTIRKYGSSKNTSEEQTFERAVSETLKRLSAVVSDGVTTENLAMLRTRFVMDWTANFSNRYPFSLFSYHERMLREGEFDAYNWWLFGKVENLQQYESWIQFHKEAISDYEKWATNNRFLPTAGDFHNREDFKNLFPKKKNRGKS